MRLVAEQKNICPRAEKHKLHYVYTCLVVTMFSLTVGLYQFGGNPIKCWTPAQFTGFWNQYVTDYCFVENTYFLPWVKGIPDPPEREDREIVYYQWIPFILAFQALLFYIPHIIWNVLSKQSGINVEKIINMGRDTKNVDFENRSKNVETSSAHIDQCLTLQRDFGGSGKNSPTLITRCGKQQGIYVTVCYLVTKVLYLANIVGQFFMLNTFLGPGYKLWGIGIMADVIGGRYWHESGHFPRTTMCDFQVRTLGNLHTWSVQCVLWINMLNEKIFLFLWWWMFVVAIISILDLIYWFVVSLKPGMNYSFISKFLRVKGLVKLPKDEDEIHDYVKRLRPDGVFIFRLLSQNAGELITADIIEAMWKRRIAPPHKKTMSTIHGPTGTVLEEQIDSPTEPLISHDKASTSSGSSPPPYRGETASEVPIVQEGLGWKKMD